MMVYVAQRVLKEIDRDNKVTVYRPGEEIPDFDSWNIHARRAHLNLHWVTKEDRVEDLEPEQELDFEPTDEDAKPLVCSKCKKEFKNEKGLRAHIGRAHP